MSLSSCVHLALADGGGCYFEGSRTRRSRETKEASMDSPHVSGKEGSISTVNLMVEFGRLQGLEIEVFVIFSAVCLVKW